jgi:hypothetical protein
MGFWVISRVGRHCLGTIYVKGRDKNTPNLASAPRISEKEQGLGYILAETTWQSHQLPETRGRYHLQARCGFARRQVHHQASFEKGAHGFRKVV